MNIDEEVWIEWLKGRPEAVIKLATKIHPFSLYRIKSSGHIGFPVQYDEPIDGSEPSVLLSLTFDNNPNMLFERNVFGLKENDLEEIKK